MKQSLGPKKKENLSKMDRHAKNLPQLSNEKQLSIMNKVKSGELSIEDALRLARMDEMELHQQKSQTEEDQYNFSVHKHSRYRWQKRVLQIDFKTELLCSIEKGVVKRQLPFSIVRSCDDGPGSKFSISFREHHDYELEATSVEDKQKMLQLLNRIIYRNIYSSTEGGDVETNQQPEPSQSIREGILFLHRGGLASLRWVKYEVKLHTGQLVLVPLKQGSAPEVEMAPDAPAAATPTVIHLSDGYTGVQKPPSPDCFTLVTHKNEFQFRVPVPDQASPSGTLRHERDAWVEAIDRLCSEWRRKSKYEDGLVEMTSPRDASITEELERNGGLGDGDVGAVLRPVDGENEGLAPGGGDRPSQGDTSQVQPVPQRRSRKSAGPPVSPRQTAAVSPSPFPFQPSPIRTTSISLPSVPEAEPASPDVKVPQPPDLPAHPFQLAGWLPPNPDAEPALPVVKVPPPPDLPAKPIPPAALIPPNPEAEPALPVVKVPPPPGLPAHPIPLACRLPPAPPPLPRKLRPNSKIARTKAFHWDVVGPEKFEKSFWNHESRKGIEIDPSRLLRQFAVKNVAASGAAEPSQVQHIMLNEKIAHNFNIFLKSFPVQPGELKDKLFVVSEGDGGLSDEHITSLRREKKKLFLLVASDGTKNAEYVPTLEDIEMYKSHKGPVTELHIVDQYMMEMCNIPCLGTQLDLLLTLRELPVTMSDLQPLINQKIRMCTQLSSSRSFVCVLEYLLAIGNYLNENARKEKARGVRLSSLAKLSQLRGSDKKFTLLHALVEQIVLHEPCLASFTQELAEFETVPGASIKGLTAELDVLKNELQKVIQYTKKSKKGISAEHPKFSKDLKVEIERYKVDLSVLMKTCEEMKKLYSAILVKFGEPADQDSRDLFGLICQFVHDFKRAHADVM